jgi:transposase
MDLRERIAAALDSDEGSQREIAARFRVSLSFVSKLLQRRRQAGTLLPKARSGGRKRVLGPTDHARLARLLSRHPDATLKELKQWGGFHCTLSTLWRALR